MKKLFLFLFLISCSLPGSNNDVSNNNLDFKDNLTFDELKKLLIRYVEKNPYPSIDN